MVPGGGALVIARAANTAALSMAVAAAKNLALLVRNRLRVIFDNSSIHYNNTVRMPCPQWLGLMSGYDIILVWKCYPE